MPILKIILFYKALPNSVLSSTTCLGNIPVFKIKQISSTMHVNKHNSYADILTVMQKDPFA